MKFFKEFGEFIKRGNVLDLAVGIIIGGAFQKIVSSLVNDIIMPLISIIGGVNISEAKWIMKAAVIENGAVVSSEIALAYGEFIQTIIDFLIIAFAVFVAVKVANRVSLSFVKAKSNIENLVVKEKAELQKIVLEEKKELKKIAEQDKPEKDGNNSDK